MSSKYHCGSTSFASKEEQADKERERHVFVQRSNLDVDAVRYDLFPGTVSANDVFAVAPLDEDLVKVAHSVCGDVVLELVRRMNNGTAGDEIRWPWPSTTRTRRRRRPPSMGYGTRRCIRCTRSRITLQRCTTPSPN